MTLSEENSSDDIVLGIRPEAFHLQKNENDLDFEGVIEIEELTGPEKIVSIKIGEDRLIATFSAEHDFSAGETIKLYVPYGRVSLFDAHTQKRVPLDK